MRIVFMGTPEFAVPILERLVLDGYEISAVFTQPDRPVGRSGQPQAPPVKVAALKLGIPVHQPAKIKSSESVRAILEQIRPGACVVAAYGKILPKWMLDIPRLGCINVHASLLPKYRGAAPINWAIANGERETGVSIMQMDEGMDTGPVWSQAATTIGDEETAIDLTARLALLGSDLLSATLPIIESGQKAPIPQDQAATYAPMLKREDGLIDWGSMAKQISDRVRAFVPWPGSFTVFRGVRLIIWRAAPVHPCDSGHFACSPGTVTRLDKTGFTVQCAGNTGLFVSEVQVEGKRRMPAREFANGARLKSGESITQLRARNPTTGNKP